jgi:N-acetylmuramoyl-L-alanine amidase
MSAMFLWNKKITLNYEERRDGAEPNILLMHYTGMETGAAALDRLTDIESKVSVHYLIDEDGTVRALVPEGKRAWHAGLSSWHGETDINSYSIGIEIVNPGHEFGYRPFPHAQMESVLTLSREIMARNNIKYVLGHSDVAPERKKDPGELFDWRFLAEGGVGLWPEITDADMREAEHVARNDYDAQKLLVRFGYNPAAASVDVVTAYHRHFFPERFGEAHEGEICLQGIARLLALLRQQET